MRHGGDLATLYDFTDPRTEAAAVPLSAFDDADFRSFLQLAVGGLGPIGCTIRDGRDGIFIVGDPDSSWVEIYPDAAGGPIVAYGGRRLLWPQIAEAWHRYTDLGRPAPDRFGLTAHDNCDLHIWLDHDHQAAGR